MIAGLLVGLAIGFLILRARFRHRIASEIRALLGASKDQVGPAELRSRWPDLPAPARRYLSYSIGDETPPLRTARVVHGGTFRMRPDAPWRPIRGRQHFSVAHPGFVWDASVVMAPGLRIQARDALLGGRGSMLVKLGSALTMANAGGADVDQGASLRWLAESVWFPFAFVSEDVRWDAIDEHRARVSLTGQAPPVSAVLEIDPAGRIVGLRADRHRDLGGGRSTLTVWTGVYREYRSFGGFTVPTSVEAAWDLPEGPFTYARFHVESIEYNVDR